MNNFKKGGFKKGGFGGPKRFGKPGGFSGGRDFKRPELHDATCGDCGKGCQVPFRPTGERPVYCRDCFAKNAPASPREFGGGFKKDFRKNFDRERGPREFGAAPRTEEHSRELAQQLEMVNTKLDRLIAIFEKQQHQDEVKQALDSIEMPRKKPARKIAKKA